MSSTGRGTVRNESDFYSTPYTAFSPLLTFLPREVSYWEPACGDGRLVHWMRNDGLRADGADLNKPALLYSDSMENELDWGVDFLKDTTRREFVITNPPFTIAFDFCQHALEVAPEVMLLLRLNFLASIKRKRWFQENEPNALFVLSQRPSFTNGGTDSCDYCWMYFGRRMQGIHHL